MYAGKLAKLLIFTKIYWDEKRDATLNRRENNSILLEVIVSFKIISVVIFYTYYYNHECVYVHTFLHTKAPTSTRLVELGAADMTIHMQIFWFIASAKKKPTSMPTPASALLQQPPTAN